MNLPFRPYPKSVQVKSKRIKPTQTQLGDISIAADRALKERSGGVCELQVKCNGWEAAERAHIYGRRIIPHKTHTDDLFHLCNACHRWLDRTPEGIRFRKETRAVGTTAVAHKLRKEREQYEFS